MRATDRYVSLKDSIIHMLGRQDRRNRGDVGGKLGWILEDAGVGKAKVWLRCITALDLQHRGLVYRNEYHAYERRELVHLRGLSA